VYGVSSAERPGRRQRPWTLSRVAAGIRRYGPLALFDCVAVGSCYVLSIAVRTGGRPEVLDPQLAPYAIGAAFGAGVLHVLCNLLFDVYWRDWSAAAMEDMVAIVKASALVVLVLLAFNLATDTHWIPTGAILAGGSLSLIVEAALHLRPRWPQIVRAAFGRPAPAENLIVYGAGRLGQLLAADITHGGRGYRIACFVDDDNRRIGSYVRGVRVAGRLADLPELIEQYGATTVVIAIAEPHPGLIRRVMDVCDGQDIRVRRVSGFALLRGDTTPLQPIGIEELLAREPVNLANPETTQHYSGRRVLVTGAAGSIGSELSRQLMHLSPARLFLLDTNESGLHAVHQSLGESSDVEIVLGDIRDVSWLQHTFRQVRPEVVFHAAAYKHVPILERTPLPGIATNVIGTANVLDAVREVGAERFVFVSTDKAVEPTSVLGYTKRFGELMTLAEAREAGRHYGVVRFGNVLGSAGSAVPVFASQIDHGGPVTVTHPEATRYFMTVEEAVALLIQAGALAMPADILVLDMGLPVSITELAQRMIRLRGLRTPADIQIEYVGLRPGEKLHEQLLSPQEEASGTSHPRVMRVRALGDAEAELPSRETFRGATRAIGERLGENDAEGALEILAGAIGGATAQRSAGMLVDRRPR
jgi:FlaA1/EpsC-like NDP-sugar epimerase